MTKLRLRRARGKRARAYVIVHRNDHDMERLLPNLRVDPDDGPLINGEKPSHEAARQPPQGALNGHDERPSERR